MLAGPPPSFNAGHPSQQTQAPSQMYPPQFQPPILPPNFTSNQQAPPTSLPGNFPSTQHHPQLQSQPQNPIGNQQYLPTQFQPPPSNLGNNQQFPPQNQAGNQQFPPQNQAGSQQFPPQNQAGNQQFPPQNQAGNQQFPPQNQAGNQQFPPQNQAGSQQFPPQNQPGSQQFPPQNQAGSQQFPPQNQAGSQQFPPQNQIGNQQFPTQPPNVGGIQQQPTGQFASHPPPVMGGQQQPQYPTQPPMMSNGMNQPRMQPSYPTQGPPTSNQMRPAPITPNQFGAPTTMPTPQFPPQQPPPPSGLGNVPQYQQQSQPPTAAGYPSSHIGAHYPTQQNLSGPPTMPGSHLNGPIGYPSQPQTQPPYQSQRIDPDMVPNVVQVLEQSQEKNQESFITNAPGLVPPLAATNYICQDQGSCNPRFIRSTVYTMPNAADMIKQSHIPVALAVTPLANLRSDELEPPVTNFGEIGPVRCHRCKAYMCSFMQFIDGGKRFICCFCEAATDVPTEYFNHLDHTGRRMDYYQRPELCLGSYEILATKQYCKDEKWPEPPAFIFMIDVSYNSVRSGLLEYICQILKNELLNFLPKDKNAETSNVRVGFATFDKQIHFYNIKGNTLGQPQMMIVSDLEDIFVPLLDGFLCLAQDSRGVINSLLDQIPQTFANSQETETILAPVIQSGIQALKGANCSGKIYIFSTTLPIAASPGKLSNRDDKKLLGNDKEKTLLAPVNNVYTKLGEECAQNGCAVDLFVFPNNYLDLATIGEVCRLSGGEIYKFNYFSIENDGERLLDELKRNFQRTTAFDALMRVRTSTGIRPIDFLGNFYMTNTTEMIFGTIDSDKSVSVELKHDDKLPVESNTYIQAALLYTSISGQRRLRILTLALTVTSSYTSLYPSCDLDTIMNYVTKVALRSVTMSTPKSIRDNIVTQASNMLACYRKHCAQSTTAGQLILPETLKLLPIFATSLIKCDALTGTQTVTTDDRTWLMHRLMSMDIKGTSAYLYPRIFALHNLEEDHIPPAMVRCSYERFTETGAFLVENGFVTYIWLGSQVNQTFVQSLFGIQAATHIQPEKCRIVDLDNPISKNVRALLNYVRNERNSYMKLFVIQQRDSIEPFFKNYLVEDKGFTGGASYVDFLYHLHREIRNILQ